MRMRRVALPLSMLTAAVFLAAGPAMAACSGNVQYDDDFTKADRSWGTLDDKFSIGNGVSTFSAPVNSTTWRINAAFIFQDASFCIDIAPKAFKDATQVYAGAIFWSKDINNFYVFQLSPFGSYSVQRRVVDRWVDVVPWTPNAVVKKAAGETNSVEIDAKGNTAALSINGTKVEDIHGQPAAGGWSVGFLVSSEKDTPTPFEFKNLKVTDLQ